ncbi:fungal fucose-specific lectin [Wilcoxina mikolae CBS 423.85]|nr:fungal fucose-specific lectin [Wilcoxina mikolae CBS 423.85]
MSNSDISPGVSIAAASPSKGPIFLFFQDTDRYVRLSRKDGNTWSGGTSRDILFRARAKSPLAATAWGDSSVRVYYIDTNSTLQEYCTDDLGRSWYVGAFGGSPKPGAATETRLAATSWINPGAIQLRVYYQTPTGKIIEHMWTGNSWSPGSPMPTALLGSSLAVPCFLTQAPGKHPVIRVYYQDTTAWIREHVYTGSWNNGDFPSVEAPKHSPLSTVGWDDLSQMRVYYRSYSNEVVEVVRLGGNGWIPNTNRLTPCIPESMIAASMPPGVNNPAIYYQKDGSELQEFLWNGRIWSMGAVIPT